jgi:transcription antitermination factor NusG
MGNRSRREQAYHPLFPGYLFVCCDLKNNHRLRLHRMPHVRGWVNFGDYVPPVPDEAIAQLMARLEGINREGGCGSGPGRGKGLRQFQ